MKLSAKSCLFNSIFIVGFLTITTVSCNNINPILKGNNFEEGDWLLVNRNYLNDSILIIDDEKILKNNSSGLTIDFSDDDKATTCDGIILLYKNGKLTNSQEYLSKSHLVQSTNLKLSFKTSHQSFLNIGPGQTLALLCDSLLKTKTFYPVINSDIKDSSYIITYERLPQNGH